LFGKSSLAVAHIVVNPGFDERLRAASAICMSSSVGVFIHAGKYALGKINSYPRGAGAGRKPSYPLIVSALLFAE
jgi:hypothetical protein